MIATNLGDTTVDGPVNPVTLSDTLPLPTELAGTKVLVQDALMANPIVAPLYFVSPGQINFQVPFEVTRLVATVTVVTPQGNGNALQILLLPMAPGIFTQNSSGTGMALAFDGGYHTLTSTPPSGGAIVFYATGLGATGLWPSEPFWTVVVTWPGGTT